MARMKLILLVFAVFVSVALGAEQGESKSHDHEQHKHEEDDVDDKELPPEEAEQLEYHKGSLCGYCTYCKFCKLCDLDCPCEQGPTKPNCHMCKYCKFCYLCKICDTVCQPGGIIDRISGAVFSSLPRYNKEEIDKDIEGVQTWIDKKKDEL